MTIIIGLLVGLFLMATLICIVLFVKNASLEANQKVLTNQLAELQSQLDVVLKRTEPKTPTEEMLAYKSQLDAKWKSAFAQQQKEFKVKAESIQKELRQFQANFSGKLQEEYKKAVDSIAFHTVEYKKTITKKRKEFSRKNKATRPQRVWRSIDDE